MSRSLKARQQKPISAFFVTSKSGLRKSAFSDSTKLSHFAVKSSGDVNKVPTQDSSQPSQDSVPKSKKRSRFVAPLLPNKKKKTNTEKKKSSLITQINLIKEKILFLRQERCRMEEDLSVEDDALSAIGQNIRQLHIDLNKQISVLQGITGVEGQDDNLIVRSEKVMLDNVHGRQKIPGVCIEIIDTPQFHRLRSLKQLGLCYYVYPTACHNRFEHSIGVMHLAGKLIRGILERQPALQGHVSEKDILCVQIAGLCHDLGHGPFSHVFDNILLKRLNPNSLWTHEDAGCDIIDYMVSNNIIDLEKYGINHTSDLDFIKECIIGVDKKTCFQRDQKQNGWQRRRFLYFIINNTESGLDVDKLDYYQRDCKATGIQANDSFDELLDTAMVMECMLTSLPSNLNID